MNRAFKIIRLSAATALLVPGLIIVFVALALAKGVKGMNAAARGFNATADGLRD